MLGRTGRGEGAGDREERDLAALEIVGGAHLFGAAFGHLHQRGLGQSVSGLDGHRCVLSCEGYLEVQSLGRGGAESSGRSEEHTSELQSLMRISYAVFCLKKN